MDRMRRQKGQDIIEYALMLAIIVGIGGWIYNAGASGSLTRVHQFRLQQRQRSPGRSFQGKTPGRVHSERYHRTAPAGTVRRAGGCAPGETIQHPGDFFGQCSGTGPGPETEYPDQRGGRLVCQSPNRWDNRVFLLLSSSQQWRHIQPAGSGLQQQSHKVL